MKKISEHAAAAKAIRKELKDKFPDTKFSVTSKSYSGGDSISISWENGAQEKEVRKITGKYTYGSFDPSTDMYNYNSSNSGLPQTKHIFLNREITQDVWDRLFEQAKSKFSELRNELGLDETNQELFEKFSFWTARNFIAHLLKNRTLQE